MLGLGILLFPETPRYAYRYGRIEEAKRTLCKVYGAPDNHYSIFVQLREIEEKLQAETRQSGGMISEFSGMFRAPRMPYRIALGMTLQAFQQLTGANYFFYYGTTIFKSVQIESFVTQMILNGINFGTTFIGLYLIEHYGRRKSLIAGSIWMFVCFLIFASVGHFSLNITSPQLTPQPGIALIVFACLFILGYATTWGPVSSMVLLSLEMYLLLTMCRLQMIWTVQAEIFPSRYRATAMGLSTASNWTWNFLIAFFTPFITDSIDFRYGYVFAGCNFAAAVIVYFFLIEGQGKTLEEIDTLYIRHIAPWKSAKWTPEVLEREEKEKKDSGIGAGTEAQHLEASA